jgi:hypothetical protein
MKVTHVLLGAGFLAAAAAFGFGVRGGWMGIMLCAVLSLWYLPIGTALSLVQITLLLIPALHRH